MPINLRNFTLFTIPAVNRVYNGSESISNLGPRIWNLIPNKLKELESVNLFKKEIKKWRPTNCPCRLCRTYIPNLGFV